MILHRPIRRSVPRRNGALTMAAPAHAKLVRRPPARDSRMLVRSCTVRASLLHSSSRGSSPAMAPAASPTLDRIKASGTITFGYRDGAAPFSASSATARCAATRSSCARRSRRPSVARSASPNLKVAWKPVDGETRIADVVARKIDAECGTHDDHAVAHGARRFHRADLRRRRQRAGARRARCAHRSLRDLADKRIAVMPATTTETALRKALAVTGATATLVTGEGRRRGRRGAARRQGRCLRIRPHAARAAEGRTTPRAANSRSCENDFSFEPYGHCRAARRPRLPPARQPHAGRALQVRRDRSRSSSAGSAPYGKPGAAAECNVLSQRVAGVCTIMRALLAALFSLFLGDGEALAQVDAASPLRRRVRHDPVDRAGGRAPGVDAARLGRADSVQSSGTSGMGAARRRLSIRPRHEQPGTRRDRRGRRRRLRAEAQRVPAHALGRDAQDGRRH